MKVIVNTELERLQMKAREAMRFMENHPAIASGVHGFHGSLFFSIETVCKNGYSEHAGKSGITVWRNSKLASRFKKEFEEELKDYTKEQIRNMDPYISITAPYEKVFGYSWKFDHVEYWGEITFSVFKGSPKRKDAYDRTRWTPCAGVETGGRSFEEMIINLADGFRKAYGNFKSDDFITKEEKEHNKGLSPFFTKPIKDKKLKKKYGDCCEMVSNKKYIHINEAEINLRWQKWFAKTPGGKKWLSTLDRSARAK